MQVNYCVDNMLPLLGEKGVFSRAKIIKKGDLVWKATSKNLIQIDSEEAANTHFSKNSQQYGRFLRAAIGVDDHANSVF